MFWKSKIRTKFCSFMDVGRIWGWFRKNYRIYTKKKITRNTIYCSTVKINFCEISAYFTHSIRFTFFWVRNIVNVLMGFFVLFIRWWLLYVSLLKCGLHIYFGLECCIYTKQVTKIDKRRRTKTTRTIRKIMVRTRNQKITTRKGIYRIIFCLVCIACNYMWLLALFWGAVYKPIWLVRTASKMLRMNSYLHTQGEQSWALHASKGRI